MTVLGTLRETWRLVFDLDRLVRLNGPWLALLTAALLLQQLGGDRNDVRGLIIWLGAVAVAGSWQRLVLTRATPAWYAVLTSPTLRLHQTLLAMAIPAFAVITVVSPVAGELVVGRERTGGLGLAGGIVLMAALGTIAWLSGRLALALPAVAIRDPSVWLIEALALTRGQGWRCVAVQVLAAAPLPLAYRLLAPALDRGIPAALA